MPRKIIPPTDFQTVTAPAGNDQLSEKFWQALKGVGVPSSAFESVGAAVIDFIVNERQRLTEYRITRSHRRAAMNEGIQRIEAARDWLRDHDPNYLDVAMSYLVMANPGAPNIPDYVDSLNALALAMRAALTHDADRTRHGPSAWAGHEMARQIVAALTAAGSSTDTKRKGLLVKTLAVSIEEAGRIVQDMEDGRIAPDIKHHDPDENARDWARKVLGSREGE